MKILTVSLIHLRNEEWNSLLTDFVELVPVYGAANLGIDDLFEQLSPLYEKADSLQEVLDKSAYTAEMVEADKERNALFRGLYNIAKVSRMVSDPAEKEAAERLFILLSNYRKAALNSSYAEESSAIDNLLQDLAGKYAADINLLGFGKIVQNIDAAEQKFQTFRKERIKEDIAKPQKRVKEIRKQADALYKNIKNVLYARLVADGLGGNVAVNPDELKTGTYDDETPDEWKGNITYNFVIAWNAILKRYQTMLAARAGRRAKAKDREMPADDSPSEA
jgi:hypothetical protein